MKLKLIRDMEVKEATLGKLYADGEFLCYTLENLWLDNKRSVSCVPEGVYKMETKEYGRYWERYNKPIPILQDVPGRSEILIHPGNYAKDTFGCILVGDAIDDTVPAVWNSRRTWHYIYPTLAQATEITIEGSPKDN